MNVLRRGYQCRYFKIYELVPRKIYKELGNKAWKLFDWRALYTLDCLREFFGKLTVNDWYWGGKRQYAGWRPQNCRVGSKWSLHKRGAAFDPKSKTISAEQMRLKILEHNILFPYISAIESDTPTWVHFDLRCDESDTILVFAPPKKRKIKKKRAK